MLNEVEFEKDVDRMVHDIDEQLCRQSVYACKCVSLPEKRKTPPFNLGLNALQDKSQIVQGVVNILDVETAADIGSLPKVKQLSGTLRPGR